MGVPGLPAAAGILYRDVKPANGRSWATTVGWC